MAVIAECSRLLVISHYLGAAAVAAVKMCMILKVLLELYGILRDTVLCIGAELLYLLHSERTQAVLTGELLLLRVKF